jgi:ribosomal protein S12 methylthiotransferase accessory factor
MENAAPAWINDLVSDRVGIIRTLSRMDRGAAEPTPPVFYQSTLNHFDFRKRRAEDRLGVGKGVTDAEAIGGAVGEALERYCGAQPDPAIVRRFAWKDRPTEAITPDACVLYSERQYAKPGFPYARWREDVEMLWAPAADLVGAETVWAPTSLIYLDYPGNTGDLYFCPPTSNGLGAGPSLEAAALSGLYELIERDSFVITWMNRLPPTEIIAPVSRAIETAFIGHYARFDIETRVFRLVTDLPVHVMMAALVDRSGRGPAALVGLGCHGDPAVAFRKAIFEAAQTRPGYVHRFGDRATWESLRDYADVRTLDDHSAFFSPVERLPELDFLFAGGAVREVDDLEDFTAPGGAAGELHRIAGAVAEAGCRPVAIDLTTADLTAYPIRVARVLAPGLQPIHFGHGEERLGGRRLFELPWRLGHRSSAVDQRDLNPCPHPLS